MTDKEEPPPFLSPGMKLFLSLNLLLFAALRSGMLSALLPVAARPAALQQHTGTRSAADPAGCPVGGLELSQLFSSHMVLQRGEPSRVWGWAPLGCAVSVLLEAEGGGWGLPPPVYAAVAHDGLGQWVATLPVQPGSLTSHRLTVRTAAGSALVLTGVLFGEVLGCFGQSNIARSGIGSVASALTLSPEVAEATQGLRAALAAEPLPVRYLGIGVSLGYPEMWHSGPEGLPDFPHPIGMPWLPASTLTEAVLQNCSSTCWLWGREVAGRLGGSVPVGLLDAAVGGSPIQAWSTAPSLQACAAPPAAPTDFVAWSPGRPGAYYNSLIAPLAAGPLALGGLAWYNGETNSLFQEAAYYACALPRLLADYRAALRKPALWVALVELHPFFIYDVTSTPTAALRGAQQAAAAATPGVTLVPAVDLGDAAGNLHPVGMAKVRLAQRLGAAFMDAAQGHFQQGPLFARSWPWEPHPLPSSSSSCRLGVRVEFEAGSVRGGGALELRGWAADSQSSRCPEAEGVAALFCDWFSIQDSEGGWHNASAQVSAEGSALLLSVPECKAGLLPVATRSGWSGWPVVQLYDAAGYPAHPWPPTPVGEADEA